MLSKIVKGRDFNGVLAYVWSKPGAKLVCQNLQGRTNSDRTLEFNEVWSLRKRVQRPVFHASLSLPVGEGITRQAWKRVVRDYLKGMGFKNCRYVAVRHQDTDHEHVHIIASRVTDEGKLVSDSWDYLKSQSVVRLLEKRYQLTPCPSSSQCLAKSPSVMEIRIGRESVKTKLQRLIEQEARTSQDFEEFSKRLARFQVNISFKWNQHRGIRQGILYEYQGYRFWGGNLGKAFTEYGLHRYLLGYSSAIAKATPISSPWLSSEQGQSLYRAYARNSDHLTDIARQAQQDGWSWEAIRFILSQSQWFKHLKQKVGRRLSLKALNVAIAVVSEAPLPPGMEFEVKYVNSKLEQLNLSHYFLALPALSSRLAQLKWETDSKAIHNTVSRV